jgi:hypothetical protein
MMRSLFAVPCWLLLMAVPVSADISAGNAPLPPGKPAGVRHAGLDGTAPVFVGVAVATGIALILASSTSGSSPVTAG